MSDSVQKYSASRMGSAPIGPLLLSCSVPMMISMLVQALYNIVDSIFVSRVNEAALSAVSLAFPIQNLMIAFAVGTAVGVNAYLSRCLGEGNRAEASRAAMNGLFLAFCGGIAFLRQRTKPFIRLLHGRFPALRQTARFPADRSAAVPVLPA